MKLIRNLLDKVAPTFKEGGSLERFYPIFEATDTILFSTDERTKSGPHIRDSIDIKRVMILVVLSLIPCYIFGAINVGYQKALTHGLSATLLENLITGLFTTDYLLPSEYDGEDEAKINIHLNLSAHLVLTMDLLMLALWKIK